MCLAIYRPPSRKLPKDIVRKAIASNKDGAGFAYALNDTLMVYRDPLAKFETFWPVLRDAMRGDAKNAPFVVHFRLATHGTIAEPNTHPILTHGGRNAVIHNGVISASPTRKDDDRSDTALFCHQMLASLPERLDQHPELQPYLESLIGYSKMVVLNASGAVTFLRAHAGTWHEEIWYSNTHSLPWTKPATPYQPPISAPAVRETTTITPPKTQYGPQGTFRLIGTFDSTHKGLTVKIDGFLSQYGTLYIRARNRTGGGGFYSGEATMGRIRMCDACNDVVALDYDKLNLKCYQRLCEDCHDDWGFIRNFLDTQPVDLSTQRTSKAKRRKMRRLTQEELDKAFAEADVTPSKPPAIQLVEAPPLAPLPEPQPTDAADALLPGEMN